MIVSKLNLDHGSVIHYPILFHAELERESPYGRWRGAEPTAYRWIFYRSGTDVWIRLLHLHDGGSHDEDGAEIWSSRQTVDSLARTLIRCFDQVAHQHGETEFQDKWGSPFPRMELEALRTAWRNRSR
jgi:hypothetical protein